MHIKYIVKCDNIENYLEEPISLNSLLDESQQLRIVT